MQIIKRGRRIGAVESVSVDENGTVLDTNGRTVRIKNSGASSVFFSGKEGVTAADGWELAAGETELLLLVGKIYLITNTLETTTVQVLYLEDC